MSAKPHVVLALALLIVAPGSGRAQELSAFEGRWTAATVTSSDQTEIRPSELELEIRKLRDGGFAASWTRPSLAGDGPKPVDARFTSTGEPGVFAVKAPEPSLIERLFAPPATGNPLERETLLWGRMSEDELILYSLSISHDGQPTLVRTRYLPVDEGLSLEREVRVGADEPIIVRAQMARTGS